MIQVLGYLGTMNLGDTIQTVALSMLLPQARAINRQYMDHPSPEPFIVNGWLGPYPEYPTSANVFFCGVHCHDDQFQRQTYERTVGARDTYTKSKVESWGRQSQFIGCASLLFPRYEGPRHGVYSVDSRGPGTPLTHAIPRDMSWGEQWQRALDVLELYRTAEHVYTGRLHVFLPCVAMGTPVTLLWRVGPERLSIVEALGLPHEVKEPQDIRTIQKTYQRFVANCLQTELTLGNPKYPQLTEAQGRGQGTLSRNVQTVLLPKEGNPVACPGSLRTTRS